MNSATKPTITPKRATTKAQSGTKDKKASCEPSKKKSLEAHAQMHNITTTFALNLRVLVIQKDTDKHVRLTLLPGQLEPLNWISQ